MKVGHAAERLRAEVMTEARSRGGRFPSERALALQLGISRGTLRAAMEMLEEEGVIWRGVGSGTWLAGHQPRNGGLIVDSTSPTEVMQARAALEPGIAAIAAVTASRTDLAALEACLAESRMASSVRPFEDLDSRFHRLIAQSADNSLLLTLFEAVNAAREWEVWGELKSASLTTERMALYCDQHTAILAALRNRDRRGASEAMAEHLRTVQRNLLDV